MVFQQGDTLTDTLNALRLQLLLTGRDGLQHVLHVRIVEHCAMHDVAPVNMVASRSADFLVTY